MVKVNLHLGELAAVSALVRDRVAKLESRVYHAGTPSEYHRVKELAVLKPALERMSVTYYHLEQA